MKQYIAFLLALLLLFTAACQKVPADNGGAGDGDVPGQNDQTGSGDGDVPGSGDADKPDPPKTITIRLTAVGDNLLHDSVSYTAQQADGNFDYSVLYDQIAPMIKASDLAFINQEVMLTGQVSPYPSIAAMGECAAAMKSAGFDIVNLATNHTLDKGISGLEACLQYVHAQNFAAVTGAFRTEDESKQQIIVETQGIRFGFLAYTYGINGQGLSDKDAWRVALTEEEKIRTEVSALRKNCDYLVVSMHWGQEYKDVQNAKQEQLASLLAELGTDLVIGTHPHVLQPAAWYDRPDGGRMYCTYSLGNFISNQRKWAALLGGMLDITLEFDESGKLKQVIDAGIIPTVTHYETTSAGSRGHRVYLLEDYTEALASAHGIRDHVGALTLEWLQNHASAVLGDQMRQWRE